MSIGPFTCRKYSNLRPVRVKRTSVCCTLTIQPYTKAHHLISSHPSGTGPLLLVCHARPVPGVCAHLATHWMFSLLPVGGAAGYETQHGLLQHQRFKLVQLFPLNLRHAFALLNDRAGWVPSYERRVVDSRSWKGGARNKVAEAVGLFLTGIFSSNVSEAAARDTLQPQLALRITAPALPAVFVSAEICVQTLQMFQGFPCHIYLPQSEECAMLGRRAYCCREICGSRQGMKRSA